MISMFWCQGYLAPPAVLEIFSLILLWIRGNEKRLPENPGRRRQDHLHPLVIYADRLKGRIELQDKWTAAVELTELPGGVAAFAENPVQMHNQMRRQLFHCVHFGTQKLTERAAAIRHAWIVNCSIFPQRIKYTYLS